MMKAKTLTFSYNPREDRIIFIMNHDNPNERVDLLVTRKKLLDILNGFDQILINHCDNGKLFKELYHAQEPLKIEKKTVNKSEEETTKSDSNKWEKAVSSSELSLTNINEPVLLDTLSYTLINNVFHFKFFNQNNLKATASMTKENFQQTLSSLMRVVPFVAWGISPHILD